jgi:FtsJ-like methyltransferase
MINLKKIENICKHNINSYENLFKYDIELYNIIAKKMLFNHVYFNTICNKKYEYDFQKEIFADIIFNEQFYYLKKFTRYGFNFENIIINNLSKPKTKKLIITNYTLILYNYDLDYTEKHKSENADKSDVILFLNHDYSDELNKSRVNTYKQLPSLNNIYSTHALADYKKFLQNIINGNDLVSIPSIQDKYNFISCHYNYIYGLNQTASIRGNLNWPLYISTIAVAMKHLEPGGMLVIFSTIINTHVPSNRKLIGLLVHAFQKVEVVSNDINQNILIGVPEFYFKCTGYKDNISSGLLDSLIQCGIDTIDNVYNVCDVMDWLDSYIEREPAQTLFYKSTSSIASANGNSNSNKISRNKSETSRTRKPSQKKSLRLSQFLESAHGTSKIIQKKEHSKTNTKKISKPSKLSKNKKSQPDLYYIDDINIPELNAILEDSNVGFRVMILCNQIETLFISFFDMVNYHIENSIEYDVKGAPRVSEIAIKQKTVSNLRRLLEFLEYNRLPYNRHALAVLQEKQDDLLDSFYNLYSPIESRIIHYGDVATKRLDRRGWANLHLGQAYCLSSLQSHFERMDRAYRTQRNLLDKLGLAKMPAKVQYATEDMTRGLAKFITKRFETSLPHPVISNAFIKMWECLTALNVIQATTQQGQGNEKYRVFHICEAPGQMILAARYFVENKHPGITDYDWRANSLNPFNPEVRREYGRVFSDEYGLMRGNPKKWLWGADGTGDITRVANVQWYRDYIGREMPDLNLIIGDGGLGSGNDTLVLQRLDLAQVVMVLACSRMGGSCIIKHFTPYMPNHPDSRDATSFFVGFMYLYYLAFADISLFKPYSSDMTSGEFYVVGKGFRGLGTDEDAILARLYTALEKFEANNSLFAAGEIPDTFIIQIEGFIRQMVDYNVIGYEKTNLVLTCYKELEHRSRREGSRGDSRDEGSRSKSREKMEKYLKCGDFLDEDKIEEILVPRYNKWVKLYEFV